MKPSFIGWYYKHQADGRTLVIIPGRSRVGAFIQVITDAASFNVSYSLSEFNDDGILRIGDCSFSSSGIKLCINRDDISVYGDLKYSNLIPIKGDIMGPFRFLPMECRHGVISMKHHVSGEVILNGEKLRFNDGTGYIETDSGHSFPEGYTWIQSNDFKENCSIMASIAKIPFAGFNFWGCICVVWLDGKEYRLASYRGVRIVRCEHNVIKLKQGNYHLSVIIDQREAHSLAAPKSGVMSRVIKESASCPAKFLFTKGGRTIFSGESICASYEYVISPNNTQLC